jgi:hypothetical protein
MAITMPSFRLTALLLFAALPLAAAPVDFQREIRPLLADNCFQCHGPDSDTRMANMRLDQKESILLARPEGSVVVPGKPAESLMYQRISAADVAVRMPPEYSHKSLTPAQIAKIKLWIEEGAEWKEHWAYRAPVQTPPPAVKNAAWVRNPIDRFVLAKLEAKGLEPAAAADRRTIIRRVALDLTGLPPTPAELDLYLKDLTPNAYEHMVDRYLASPHFGEQRARYWLDVARYGDTHGIHIDNYREIWPYRDWVINAYNSNLPYDRFGTEQLAGDLLPNATLDQRIATGFIRSGTSTNEAGIIEDEYAEIYAKDRAETVSAAFIGLTVGCATCHDHKFDPIQQKDFYAMGAFFRNTTQRIMDDNIPDPEPVVFVPKQEDRDAWDKLTAQLTAIRTRMAEMAQSASGAFNSWLSARTKTSVNSPLEERAELFYADVPAFAKIGTNVDLIDSNIPGLQALHIKKPPPAIVPQPNPATTVVKPPDGVQIAPAPRPNDGDPIPEPKDTSAEAPKLDLDKPFSISVSFFYPKAEQSYTIAAQNNSKDKNRGWVVDITSRMVGLKLTGDGGRTIEIRAAHSQALEHETWNTAIFTYDGSRHESGLGIYLNGKSIPILSRGLNDPDIAGDLGADQPLMLGRAFPDGAISDFRVFTRVVTEAEVPLVSNWPAIQSALATDSAKLTDSSRAALETYFLGKQYEPYQTLAKEQSDLNTKLAPINRRGSVTLVMEERTDAKPIAWTLYRGAYDQRREQVDANTPVILPPMTSTMPRNRLGLAQWLFTPDNPTTARVAVNRMWSEIFGTGIVKTAEDFGSQGEPPSHPELLDWLAVDFREHGWDMKRFYKQIMMSATYRQAAITTPAKLDKDPDNRLLSRGVRFRLDGELVRDYALAATGLLSPQIGGPSVRPYQPDNVWEAVAMDGSNTRYYKHDTGDALYRRSIYTFWKRSAPPASMDIFNAPTREGCIVRRERTDTPLQALVTMNDVQFVEAARELAGRSMQSTVDFDARLDYIALRLLIRTLSPQERIIAKKSFDKYEQYYAGHEDEARKFLNQGEHKPDPALKPSDYAALTMLTSEFLNLDEVLNK